MHHYCEFVSTKCWRLWTYNTIMHVTSNFWITWQQILSLPGHGGDTLLIKLLLLRLWVRGSCPIWWISIILCEWEHQPWWLCWWFPWKWRWWGLSWWLSGPWWRQWYWHPYWSWLKYWPQQRYQVLQIEWGRKTEVWLCYLFGASDWQGKFR